MKIKTKLFPSSDWNDAEYCQRDSEMGLFEMINAFDVVNFSEIDAEEREEGARLAQ